MSTRSDPIRKASSASTRTTSCPALLNRKARLVQLQHIDSVPMPAQRHLLHSWHDERTLFYQFDRFIVALHALTDDMIRVRVGQNGSFAARRSWSVTPA